jgi:predicted aconitase
MSPDVLDHEEQASEERLKNVQTLIPLLAAHSLASSGAMVAEHLESLSPEERERVMEFAVASQASLSEVILRSTAASISQLLGLGLLVLGTPTAVLKTEKGKK